MPLVQLPHGTPTGIPNQPTIAKTTEEKTVLWEHVQMLNDSLPDSTCGYSQQNMEVLVRFLQMRKLSEKEIRVSADCYYLNGYRGRQIYYAKDPSPRSTTQQTSGNPGWRPAMGEVQGAGIGCTRDAAQHLCQMLEELASTAHSPGQSISVIPGKMAYIQQLASMLEEETRHAEGK